MGKLAAGDTIAPHDLAAIDGSSVRVPDSGSVVHLQLRRFAGCTICHLHMLPADFLISPEGVVLAVKYGRHGDDQWSVDELLALGSSKSAA